MAVSAAILCLAVCVTDVMNKAGMCDKCTHVTSNVLCSSFGKDGTDMAAL